MSGVRSLGPGGSLVGSLRVGSSCNSLLHILAKHPDSIHLLRWLVREYPFLDFGMTNRFDETFLHTAVLANNSEAIKLSLAHSYWSERRGKLLRQLDYRGNSPLALALILGYGHCIFEILRYDKDCCTLPEERG